MSEIDAGAPDADAAAMVMTPALEVVAGEPNAEELAALVAVLTAVTQPTETPAVPAARVDTWAAPWRTIGAQVPLGPGAWSAGSVR